MSYIVGSKEATERLATSMQGVVGARPDTNLYVASAFEYRGTQAYGVLEYGPEGYFPGRKGMGSRRLLGFVWNPRDLLRNASASTSD